MSNVRRLKFSEWTGILLILLIGLVHLSTSPSEYKEAHYLGLMFVAAFIASIISAMGIYRKQPLWGWGMGLLIALGSSVGYILSRTIGLPISGVEPWGPPTGFLSLGFEMAFLAITLRIPEFWQWTMDVIQRRSKRGKADQRHPGDAGTG